MMTRFPLNHPVVTAWCQSIKRHGFRKFKLNLNNQIDHGSVRLFHRPRELCDRGDHFMDRKDMGEEEEDVHVMTLFKSELQKLSPLPDRQKQKERNKRVFKGLISAYVKKESLYRRRHVEFAREAMKQMKDFGVHKELSCYKKLLEVFPVGKIKPQTVMQVEFMHYPKQQNCAIDIMDLMESNAVIPDREFGFMLSERFGTDAHCFRKMSRMMYWLPKFKNINPFPLPEELPEDPIKLAVLALKKMAVDLENRISVWNTRDTELEPLEDTFVASAQSPTQQQLVQKHNQEKPMYVEGGYRVWLRDIPVVYFILRAEASPDTFSDHKLGQDDKDEELFDWKPFYESEDNNDIIVPPSVHEQDDGTIVATCVTGSRSKDSLITWIRYLQQTNPALKHIPVIFSLQSLEPGLEVPEEKVENSKP